MHDQGAGGDGRQQRRCERHVVIVVFQRAHLFEQQADLIVAVGVTLPLLRPVGVRERGGGKLRHGLARLRRKVWRRADQDHRLDAIWLLGRHVEQGLRAHAESDRLDA